MRDKDRQLICSISRFKYFSNFRTIKTVDDYCYYFDACKHLLLYFQYTLIDIIDRYHTSYSILFKLCNLEKITTFCNKYFTIYQSGPAIKFTIEQNRLQSQTENVEKKTNLQF